MIQKLKDQAILTTVWVYHMGPYLLGRAGTYLGTTIQRIWETVMSLKKKRARRVYAKSRMASTVTEALEKDVSIGKLRRSEVDKFYKDMAMLGYDMGYEPDLRINPLAFGKPEWRPTKPKRAHHVRNVILGRLRQMFSHDELAKRIQAQKERSTKQSSPTSKKHLIKLVRKAA